MPDDKPKPDSRTAQRRIVHRARAAPARKAGEARRRGTYRSSRGTVSEDSKKVLRRRQQVEEHLRGQCDP